MVNVIINVNKYSGIFVIFVKVINKVFFDWVEVGVYLRWVILVVVIYYGVELYIIFDIL